MEGVVGEFVGQAVTKTQTGEFRLERGPGDALMSSPCWRWVGIYRSKLHATLKRNYHLIPAMKWLRLLMNDIPDKYEHLVFYYRYFSNRSRGTRRLAEQHDDTSESVVVDKSPVVTRWRAPIR